MPSFGKKSLDNMIGVHPKLIDVLLEVIQYYDFSILEGVRTSERQKALYANGDSRTLNSKHLKQSDGYSHAVDIAPYPIDWNDKRRFAFLAGLVIATGKTKGIDITWGNDWDSDGDLDEHQLQDGPHFQLRG